MPLLVVRVCGGAGCVSDCVCLSCVRASEFVVCVCVCMSVCVATARDPYVSLRFASTSIDSEPARKTNDPIFNTQVHFHYCCYYFIVANKFNSLFVLFVCS